MWRRAAMIAFVVAGLVLFPTGVAWANGHTVNGIYHGSYGEWRSGADYHHCWTVHRHTGDKQVMCQKKLDSSFSGQNKCIAHNYGREYISHVHCTAYFEPGQYGAQGFHATDWDVHCFQSEGSHASYPDGHGICYHFRNE
jgi:hypothetical protein